MDVRSSSGDVTSALGYLPVDKRQRLRKAAEGFESIWVQNVLKEARPKESAFGKSFAGDTFQDMLGQALAQKIAESHTLGLADSLERQVMPPDAAAQQAVNEAHAAQAAALAAPPPEIQP